jgi:hypothetical protein
MTPLCALLHRCATEKMPALGRLTDARLTQHGGARSVGSSVACVDVVARAHVCVGSLV